MSFPKEIQDSPSRLSEHFHRVVLAISTAVCLFAFQNCSFVDFSKSKSSPTSVNAVPTPVEFQVDQGSLAR